MEMATSVIVLMRQVWVMWRMSTPDVRMFMTCRVKNRMARRMWPSLLPALPGSCAGDGDGGTADRHR